MTGEPDIVERLRDSGRTDWNGLVHTARDAATEIERLREQCDRLARSSLKLRQRLDATRARFTRVGEIANDALALAREINRDLLASRIGFGRR